MRRSWHKALIAMVLACACLARAGQPGFAATLTATTDRPSVGMGETFSLVLSLAGGDSSQPPDLTSLSKDFEIVERRRGSRTTIVDGKRTTVNEWALLLAPKRAGTFTIPSLSVAGVSSAPIQMQVTPAASVDSTEERPLFLEVEVGKGTPYVQSEVPVTVRIYDSLGMRSGAMSRIAADGATFAPDGDQQTYLRTIGKQRYRVIQQNYIMTPQRSGTIDIPAVRLQANVPSNDGAPMPSEMARLLGRSGMPQPWLDAAFNRGRDVTIHSEPIKVEVKARPADAQGWFLPARAVTLTSEWSSPPAKARAGDTLTRTIRLAAVGASPNQLPPVTLPDVPGVRQYEEETHSETAQIKGEAGAELTKTISVVFTRAGDVTLPAMEVGWWNTATNRQETTALPAESFTVLPGAAVAAQPAPVVIKEDVPSTAAKVAEPPSMNSGWTLESLLAWRGPAAIAAGSALALVLAGLLLSFGLLWYRRRAVRRAQAGRISGIGAGPAAKPVPGAFRARGIGLSGAAAERELTAACKRNDAVAAHRAYLAWSRGADEPRTPDMGEAVRDLRRHLYAAGGTPWNGTGFLTAFKTERRALNARAPAARGARLAPLYPKAG